MTEQPRHELALVMPVYNEEACIAHTVRTWYAVLSDLQLDFIMFVLNDGSRDGTSAALDPFRRLPNVHVVDKPNSGHGPTILEGYRRAVTCADWVFQCDSDNEIHPEYFSELWMVRSWYDAVFGSRHHRQQNFSRWFISTGSRLSVRALFGRGVEDVNTPFRLMRAELVAQLVDQIPSDTFSPNVIISGALCGNGARVHNVQVPHTGRQTGQVPIVKWKLWKAVLRSFWQTLWCRPKLSLEGTTNGTGPRRQTPPPAPRAARAA